MFFGCVNEDVGFELGAWKTQEREHSEEEHERQTDDALTGPNVDEKKQEVMRGRYDHSSIGEELTRRYV